jgi:hypothetical protein
MIGNMRSGRFARGNAEVASRRGVRVSGPLALILAVSALELTNLPLTRYRSGGQPDYLWAAISVVLVLWQIWRHGRLAWAVLTALTAVTLLVYALSIARVIDTGLPGWWIAVSGAADLLALVLLLGRPIRRWAASTADDI